MDCADIRGTLHVHHCFYVVGRLPWEYADEALLSLCEECHRGRHFEGRMRWYEEVDGELVLFKGVVECSRCEGEGWIPRWKRILGGICFRCWGAAVHTPGGTAEEADEFRWRDVIVEVRTEVVGVDAEVSF